MDHYPGKEQITVILADGQKQWLGQEANRQFSNKSALIRRAINLFMKQIETRREMEASGESGLNIRPPVGHLSPIDRSSEGA